MRPGIKGVSATAIYEDTAGYQRLGSRLHHPWPLPGRSPNRTGRTPAYRRQDGSHGTRASARGQTSNADSPGERGYCVRQ